MVKIKVKVPQKDVKVFPLKEANIQELLPLVRQAFDISKAFQLKFTYMSKDGERLIKSVDEFKAFSDECEWNEELVLLCNPVPRDGVQVQTPNGPAPPQQQVNVVSYQMKRPAEPQPTTKPAVETKVEPKKEEPKKVVSPFLANTSTPTKAPTEQTQPKPFEKPKIVASPSPVSKPVPQSLTVIQQPVLSELTVTLEGGDDQPQPQSQTKPASPKTLTAVDKFRVPANFSLHTTNDPPLPPPPGSSTSTSGAGASVNSSPQKLTPAKVTPQPQPVSISSPAKSGGSHRPTPSVMMAISLGPAPLANPFSSTGLDSSANSNSNSTPAATGQSMESQPQVQIQSQQSQAQTQPAVSLGSQQNQNQNQPSTAPALTLGGGNSNSSTSGGVDLGMDDFICDACKKPIEDGRVMEAMNKTFHPGCFACYRCKLPLMGSVLTVLQQYYFHPTCLTCDGPDCGISLLEKQFAVNKWTIKLYCVRHAFMSKIDPNAPQQPAR